MLVPKAASTRLPSPVPDEVRQLVARTPVSQETILGADMGSRDDGSPSPSGSDGACTGGEGAGTGAAAAAAGSGCGCGVDRGVIMPHSQPHNLHIWYGFFQRFSQGVSSLVPDTGVATGDAFVLTLSKRITAMEREIRELKRQQQQQKQQCLRVDAQGAGQCSASAEMLASLDLRTKSPLSAAGGSQAADTPCI